MDTHDVGRSRGKDNDSEDVALAEALGQLPRGALVIGIESDGLFMTSEQREIASHIPEARLALIPSVDGHDGFLLEFEAINRHILEFLKEKLPDIYAGTVTPPIEGTDAFGAKKTSTFGEAEVDVDVTRW
ncbi:homoserine O- acetyltransferase [Ceratobasidium sp. 428]|nr:homoserine O- acetyltransferase [Ceratobasidium sp. 428]